MTTRWTLKDSGETWTMPVNPNSATSPFPAKQIQTAQGSVRVGGGQGLGRLRMFQGPAAPADWEFGGAVRSEEQHDALLAWSKKSNEVVVSDHLGRSFEVIIRQVSFTDRTPTPDNPWRLTYTMRALVLRRIT